MQINNTNTQLLNNIIWHLSIANRLFIFVKHVNNK